MRGISLFRSPIPEPLMSALMEFIRTHLSAESATILEIKRRAAFDPNGLVVASNADLAALLAIATSQIAPDIIDYGSLRVDRGKLQSWWFNGKEWTLLNLTAREYQVLEYLVIKQGHVITREEFNATIWEGKTKGNIVDVYIRYLRDKLKAAGCSKPKSLIVARRCQGYQLSGH